jgi:hypothetical protein
MPTQIVALHQEQNNIAPKQPVIFYVPMMRRNLRLTMLHITCRVGERPWITQRAGGGAVEVDVVVVVVVVVACDRTQLSSREGPPWRL